MTKDAWWVVAAIVLVLIAIYYFSKGAFGGAGASGSWLPNSTSRVVGTAIPPSSIVADNLGRPVST